MTIENEDKKTAKKEMALNEAFWGNWQKTETIEMIWKKSPKESAESTIKSYIL